MSIFVDYHVRSYAVGSASPVKQHAYRCPLSKREAMKREVVYLLKNGFAIPSISPWSSP